MRFGKADLPDTMNIGENKLILNGAGFKKFGPFKVYVGALYLKEKCTVPEQIINDNEPMVFRIHFVLRANIPGKGLQKGFLKAFKRACNDDIESIEDRVNTFISWTPETVNQHYILDVIHTPDKGIDVYWHGKYCGNVSGFDFKKVFFTIWVGDKPECKLIKEGITGIKY